MVFWGFCFFWSLTFNAGIIKDLIGSCVSRCWTLLLVSVWTGVGGGHLHLRPLPIPGMTITQGFPTSAGLHFQLENSLLVGEGSPVHCRMFRSISGLYPLDADNNFWLGKLKLSPDIATCPPGGEIDPWLGKSRRGREHWIWNQKIWLRISALLVPAVSSVRLDGEPAFFVSKMRTILLPYCEDESW